MQCRSDEGGFTLVELLVVVGILAIISFPLTEAFIVGLKTTDDNANNMARSVGVQALSSFFTGDAQSAELVSSVDPLPMRCAATEAKVFLHLSWTDQDQTRDVSYSLESDGADDRQREVIRWSCTAGGTADRRILGLFTGGPLPVQATWECPPPPNPPPDPPPPVCPEKPTPFEAITLKIQTPEDVNLTVRRRTG